MAEREEATLMVDIGTNFEAVLGNSDWMLSCAGAAGPALEGGEVLFGMRANPGAIERVRIDPDTLTPSVSTINGVRPRGICGSGLIDLLAELFRACVIDRTGGINLELDRPRVRKGQYHPEFVVAWKEETSIGKDIVITENDIRNLIMSKAAIHAACMTLLDAAGLAPADIGRICFSGAFGNYLNKENAVTIGLIPEMPPRVHRKHRERGDHRREHRPRRPQAKEGTRRARPADHLHRAERGPVVYGPVYVEQFSAAHGFCTLPARAADA